MASSYSVFFSGSKTRAAVVEKLSNGLSELIERMTRDPLIRSIRSPIRRQLPHKRGASGAALESRDQSHPRIKHEYSNGLIPVEALFQQTKAPRLPSWRALWNGIIRVFESGCSEPLVRERLIQRQLICRAPGDEVRKPASNRTFVVLNLRNLCLGSALASLRDVSVDSSYSVFFQ